MAQSKPQLYTSTTPEWYTPPDLVREKTPTRTALLA